MVWNPHPQEDRGTIISCLGGPKIFTYPWGAEANEKFKIFHTFGGNKRLFSTGEMGGVPPSLAKNLLVLPPSGKVPPNRLPPTKYLSLTPKAHPPIK